MHERDRAAAGEVARELGERRRVGARERVDRLRAVADDAQVGTIAEPGAQQAGLQRRGVLELVDEQVPEPPALRGREVGVALDRVGAPSEEIVEVEPALAALLGLVAGVEVGELGRRSGQPALGRPGRGGVLLGRDHARLRPLDLGRDIGDRHRDRRARRAPGAEQRPEHPALAIEDARRLLAAVGGAPRSWASASAWKVPAVTAPSTPSASSRSTSSPAARRVNVTASTCRASAVCSRTRNAMRRVSTRVLPEPAGARIASGACGSVTAALMRVEIRQQRVVFTHEGDRTGRVRRRASIRVRRGRRKREGPE